MRTLALAALAVVLTACGGSSGTQYHDALDVATAAGCQHYAADDTTMYAADSGHCTHAGHYISIDWFKNNTSLDNYRTVADQLGGSTILYGPDWAITCVDSKTDCDTLKTKLGGSLG